MDDQSADVQISALTDAEQGGLPSGQMLPRHEVEPGNKISCFAKLTHIADRRHADAFRRFVFCGAGIAEAAVER